MVSMKRPARAGTPELLDHVVRVGSKVSIRNLDSGELDIYTIVRPSEADISRNMVSIFAPIGRAIDSRRVGETVEFDAPAGKVRIQIEAAHPASVVETSSG